MKWISRAAKAVWGEWRRTFISFISGLAVGFMIMFHWKTIVNIYPLFWIFCLIYLLLGGEIKTILWLQLVVPGAQCITALVIGLILSTAFYGHYNDEL